MIDLARIIHDAANAACPGACVSIGSFEDKSTWRLNPPDGATQSQIDAANAAMQAVDISPAAQVALQTAKEKADADEFVTSSHPIARANRSSARITMKQVQLVIDKVNECVAFCNSKGASITPLTKSSWPQLLAAAKAANQAETNAVQ